MPELTFPSKPNRRSIVRLTFSWSEDSGSSSRRRLCWELSSSKAACVVAVSDMCPLLSRRAGSGEPALSGSVSSFMRCWKPSQIFSFLLVQFDWLSLGSERQTVCVNSTEVKNTSAEVGWKESLLTSYQTAMITAFICAPNPPGSITQISTLLNNEFSSWDH